MVLRVIHVAPLFDVRDTSGVSLILCRYSSGEKKQTATVGRNVCLRTHAIPERLRGVFTTRRYTNTRLPLSYLYLSDALFVVQFCLTQLKVVQVIAQLSQRDRAAGWASYCCSLKVVKLCRP